MVSRTADGRLTKERIAAIRAMSQRSMVEFYMLHKVDTSQIAVPRDQVRNIVEDLQEAMCELLEDRAAARALLQPAFGLVS